MGFAPVTHRGTTISP